MQLLTVPPGGRAKAHKHEAHETALYVLSGKVGMYYGEKLENHMVTGAGDFVYIPANTPHLPYNMSQTEPATAVISRTDPNEQESVVMLPELDAIPLLSRRLAIRLDLTAHGPPRHSVRVLKANFLRRETR